MSKDPTQMETQSCFQWESDLLGPLLFSFHLLGSQRQPPWEKKTKQNKTQTDHYSPVSEESPVPAPGSRRTLGQEKRSGLCLLGSLRHYQLPSSLNGLVGEKRLCHCPRFSRYNPNQLMCPVNNHCLRAGDTVGCLNECIPKDKYYSLREELTFRIAE